jgi:hypothetical protein
MDVIKTIKNKFNETGSPADIPLRKSRKGKSTFRAELSKDGEGMYVNNLGKNLSFLPWTVFQEAVSVLERNGGRAKCGYAMGGRLDDQYLPFNSIEGHVANVVYGKNKGDTVFRRITPISCILIWAGICTSRPNELILL